MFHLEAADEKKHACACGIVHGSRFCRHRYRAITGFVSDSTGAVARAKGKVLNSGANTFVAVNANDNGF